MSVNMISSRTEMSMQAVKVKDILESVVSIIKLIVATTRFILSAFG